MRVFLCCPPPKLRRTTAVPWKLSTRVHIQVKLHELTFACDLLYRRLDGCDDCCDMEVSPCRWVEERASESSHPANFGWHIAAVNNCGTNTCTFLVHINISTHLVRCLI